MKVIKFRDHLVPFVLSGEKSSTWRLFDDKNLTIGDMLELKEFSSERPFATAKIIEIVEKPLGELSDEDRVGHESFPNDEEMYKTFSIWYNRPVGPLTEVKIIRFQLIS